MKDLGNFCKLFNINIPFEKHQEYYFERLVETGYSPDVLLLKGWYEDYENEYENPKSHKMASMQKLIDLISSSDFYNRFNTDPDVTKELADYKIDGINQTALHYKDKDNLFLSIDMSKANYQILSDYDDNLVLGLNWDNFLDINKIHPIFKYSKPFRQHVFGNLNPKRTQRHQAIVMDKLSKEILSNNPDAKLISKSYDELIYLVPKGIYTYPTHVFSDNIPYNFTQTIYKMEEIGKDKYLKTVVDKSGETLRREFKGIEGNMFYMYLRKYFGRTGMPDTINFGFDRETGKYTTFYDDRDLYFQENKRMAKWVDLI